VSPTSQFNVRSPLRLDPIKNGNGPTMQRLAGPAATELKPVSSRSRAALASAAKSVVEALSRALFGCLILRLDRSRREYISGATVAAEACSSVTRTARMRAVSVRLALMVVISSAKAGWTQLWPARYVPTLASQAFAPVAFETMERGCLRLS
jgi:hypothetical protein